MDPRDGHRECPHCLGVAHLVEDIENLCHAASELPLEERRRRAQLVEEATRNKMTHPLPAKTKDDGQSSKKSRSRKRDRSPDHYQGWGPGQSVRGRRPSPEHLDQSGDTQMKILAAIQSLSDRLTRIEAQRPVTVAASVSQEPSVASQGDLQLISGREAGFTGRPLPICSQFLWWECEPVQRASG